MAVPLSLGDGIHAFEFRAADNADNLSPVSTFRVLIDTVGPTTRVLAGATVRRHKTVTLHYSVKDGICPRALVTIRIKTMAGWIARTLPKVVRATNRPTRSRFVCTLPRGAYRFYVYAQDLAGNAQRRLGHGVLRIN